MRPSDQPAQLGSAPFQATAAAFGFARHWALRPARHSSDAGAHHQGSAEGRVQAVRAHQRGVYSGRLLTRSTPDAGRGGTTTSLLLAQFSRTAVLRTPQNPAPQKALRWPHLSGRRPPSGRSLKKRGAVPPFRVQCVRVTQVRYSPNFPEPRSGEPMRELGR